MKDELQAYGKTVEIGGPLKRITIVADDEGLLEIHLKPLKGRLPRPSGKALAIIEQTVKTLKNYFKTGKFGKLPPLHVEGTPFQKKVWKSLTKVRPGEVVSYGELAEAAGFPKAGRAVGSAMKANHFPIFVP